MKDFDGVTSEEFNFGLPINKEKLRNVLRTHLIEDDPGGGLYEGVEEDDSYYHGHPGDPDNFGNS